MNFGYRWISHVVLKSSMLIFFYVFTHVFNPFFKSIENGKVYASPEEIESTAEPVVVRAEFLSGLDSTGEISHLGGSWGVHSIATLGAQKKPIKLQLPARFKDAGRYLLLPPVQNSAHSVIVMILPGAKKNAVEYAHLAEEIQKKSFIPLWIGIAKFTGNLPNPGEANASITGLIEALKMDGLPTASLSKTFLAWHSMGGIIAQGLVKKQNYAGLILLSSYLTRKNGVSALPDFPKPVLTLSGELDGLTRITRIGLEAHAAHIVAQKIGEEFVATNKPVIIVKGANHSQFASEALIGGDLWPEISYAEAQEDIALVSADFILANSKDEQGRQYDQQNEVLSRLLDRQNATRNLLLPFESSKIDQTLWCEKAQRLLTDVLGQKDSILTKREIFTDKKLFSQSAPVVSSRNDSSVEIRIPSYEVNPSNPFDFSITPEGTSELQCKLFVPLAAAQEPLNQVHSLVASPFSSFCDMVNREMYEQELAKISQGQRLRFLSRGKKLVMGIDLNEDSERKWLNTPLKMKPFETDAKARMVQAPAWYLSMGPLPSQVLESKSQYNCKLLSPSGIMEWIILDGLRN